MSVYQFILIASLETEKPSVDRTAELPKCALCGVIGPVQNAPLRLPVSHY